MRGPIHLQYGLGNDSRGTQWRDHLDREAVRVSLQQVIVFLFETSIAQLLFVPPFFHAVAHVTPDEKNNWIVLRGGSPARAKMRRFYRASFNPDLLLVPEQDDDLPRLCYALPADSAAPLFASERLKKLLEDAVTSLGGMRLTSPKTREDMRPASVQSVRDQGSTVKGPRTITDGVHPGTKCRKTGSAPIAGWRYESTDRDANPHDLSAAAYEELDSTARAAYVRRAPVAYAPLEEPTDEDDGHLTLALPGSRLALTMLLKYDADILPSDVLLEAIGALDDEGYPHPFDDVPEGYPLDDDVPSSILNLRRRTDSRFLLAEYLELTCKLELDEHSSAAYVALYGLYDGLLEMTSAETMRIVSAITQRWPRYACSGQDKSLGVGDKCFAARSLRAMLPHLLKHLMSCDERGRASPAGVGNRPLRRLLEHSPSLSLEQLAEVLDWLPTEKLVEGPPKLQGTVKLADVLLPLSNDRKSTASIRTSIPVRMHAETTARQAEGALQQISVRVFTYELGGCKWAGFQAFPAARPGHLDGIEAYDVIITLTNLLDPTRVVTKSFSYPVHLVCGSGSSLKVDIKAILVSPTAAQPSMQTELETLIAQCSLTLSLTRRAGSMRLAVLQRWAAAHGLRVPPPLPLIAAAAPPPATLASPSIGALLCFYAECIARLEAKPGAASLLRATVLDASLVPHAVRSAATLCRRRELSRRWTIWIKARIVGYAAAPDADAAAAAMSSAMSELDVAAATPVRLATSSELIDRLRLRFHIRRNLQLRRHL